MTTENQQQEQTVENQQQDPATAAQDAAAARGAKALDTMYPEAWRRLQKARESLPPGGRVYSSPGAAALAEAEMTPPSPEEQARETRRLELLRNPAYLDGNHKDHAKVMPEIRQIMAAGQTQEERDAFVNQPVSALRGAIGVQDEFLRLPAHVRNEWDEDVEAVAIAFFNEQGIAALEAKSVYAWYINRSLANGGQFTEADGEAFKTFAKGKLSEADRKLIKWHVGDEK